MVNSYLNYCNVFYMGMPSVGSNQNFKTFKALHGLGPVYLKNYLPPVTSTWPTREGRQKLLKVPSIKEIKLVELREKMFSVVGLSLTPPAMGFTPTLLLFSKTAKTWFCQ